MFSERDNDNNSWLWLLIVLILFGTGSGWGNNAGASENYVLASDFATIQRQMSDGFGGTTQQLNRIGDGISSLGYDQLRQMDGINTTVLTTANATQQEIGNVGFQMQNCCCQTQRAIDGVNYNLATQSCDTRNVIQNSTRDIIDNANANTRSILEFLTTDKIATLQAENQNLRLMNSQYQQNQVLINELKPCPIPAYQVANPYCNYSNSCGCA